jgi:pyruvate/2-oxoglutarate dehydrogenase complex dihydrolipoamide acyltransferase (E2) component
VNDIDDDNFDDEIYVEKDFRDHIAEPGSWLRLLYMILFGIVFEVGKFVGLVVAVVQFLFKLIAGQPHPALQTFGFSLSEYYRQIIAFETFRSDDRPYPWADWPVEAKVEAAPEPAAPPPVAEETKPAAVKTPSKTTVTKGTRTRKKPAQPRKRKQAEDKKPV